jgi:hypothetical protein
MQRPNGWPPLIALVCAIAVGCVDPDNAVEPTGADDDGIVDPPPSNNDETQETGDPTQPPPPTVCNDPSTYTPYTPAAHPTGTVATLPWSGSNTTYPASNEDFRGYGLAMPVMVECANDKTTRSHLDVTAGCLNAITNTHGQIVSTDGGAFRALALGYAPTDPAHAVRWTDQSIEYSFFYSATSGAGVLPGFKAFARYNTEDDLYVASWRMDGVAQIQRKQCGQYTALKVLKNFGAPTPNTWHRIRFDAIGDTLELYLDGVKVISVTDATFASGTMGIRTDAMTGALIDDWRVN